MLKYINANKNYRKPEVSPVNRNKLAFALGIILIWIILGLLYGGQYGY